MDLQLPPAPNHMAPLPWSPFRQEPKEEPGFRRRIHFDEEYIVEIRQLFLSVVRRLTPAERLLLVTKLKDGTFCGTYVATDLPAIIANYRRTSRQITLQQLGLEAEAKPFTIWCRQICGQANPEHDEFVARTISWLESVDDTGTV